MPIDLTIAVLTVPELTPALNAHFAAPPQACTPEFSRCPVPPGAPGVYVWADPRGAVIYIGSAASLRRRLGSERAWVTQYEPAETWAVSVIHMLKSHTSEVWWVEAVDLADARALERRLIEWHRVQTGSAPPAVGWEAKKASLRERAQLWAQELWRSGDRA
ncbi:MULTISPECIES: GIY-YIG nuclease family protein [unclassified Streptomyces]|uniref:GIY-YIG nuclease family protein n=1 Tax=unclassified Streptomyces TaxID=2593676 RepID=UPI0022537F21|nr:GIY-YIG nuclease family protein [Streptomyces sp. NBC_01264]MCX4783908.1 GIY-YIG nuclease family protein [Streptomyces sp. NBC_01264]